MHKNWTQQNERQFTATVFIVSQEKPREIVFLLHKKLGVWLPPGGHIEAHEDPIQAVVREAQEETGIDISEYINHPQAIDARARKIPLPVAILEEYIDAHGKVPEHYHVDLIYTIKIPKQNLSLQETEHHDVRWFSKNDFLKIKTFKNVSEIALKLFTK